MQSTQFAAVTAITRVPDAGWTAQVHPDWTIAGKANGGYLLSMLGRVATAAGAHPHVLAASAHFLRSPDAGPVSITAEVLRTGRSAGQLLVRMLQDERPCVAALFTTGELDPHTEPYWAAGVPVLGQQTFDDAVRVPGVNPGGIPVAIMDQVDLRLDRASAVAIRRPSGRGELRGWLALPAGADFDPISLLYAVDAFPPATFDIELTGWVPTLELTVYVRALPAPGPVRVLQKAHLVDGQRVDEQCWVWDSSGRVVAHGTQLAGIRLG